jgi:hypothetical protein
MSPSSGMEREKNVSEGVAASGLGRSAVGRSRAILRNGRGVGGFYEAILAMMIVTAGVVLLTASFALLTVDRGPDDQGAEKRCDEVLGRLLNDPAYARSDRLLDQRSLSRLDGGSLMANWTGGMRILLTFPDGSTQVLFEGGEAGLERVCRSEPVNIYCDRAEVRAALLTVWVWP